MSTIATELLRELRMDHRNMAVLLNLLQEEADRIEQDEDIDFELAHDIMRYMTVYSDAVHHPREDLVYAGLLAAEPKLAAGLEQVEDQHRELAELGTRLRADFEEILAGSAVTRSRIVEDTRSYLHRLRQHMAWEEEDLFRRADSRAEALEIDDTHLRASDPVFGAQREGSFKGLFDAIQRETS
jgi:hemerythrin-like domain-containing protein